MNSNPCLLLTDPSNKKFGTTIAVEASTPLYCTCKDLFLRTKHFHSQEERYKVRSTSSQPFICLLNPLSALCINESILPNTLISLIYQFIKSEINSLQKGAGVTFLPALSHIFSSCDL